MKHLRPSLTGVDRMFRAFSDRTRLRILYLLQSGEYCVGDVVAILQVEQPTASQHLAYLRKAGLVVARKAGLWSYYSLAPAREPFHQKLLECLACCFGEVPEIQTDASRAKRVKNTGGCCTGTEDAKPKKAKKSAGRLTGRTRRPFTERGFV